MEHLQGQILPALGTLFLIHAALNQALFGTKLDRSPQTGLTEGVQRGHAVQPMKGFQRFGFVAESTGFLGWCAHGETSKSQPRRPAT